VFFEPLEVSGFGRLRDVLRKFGWDWLPVYNEPMSNRYWMYLGVGKDRTVMR